MLVTLAGGAFTSFRPTISRPVVGAAIDVRMLEAFNPVAYTKVLPGVSEPLGYFDPLGFCAGDASEGRIRFLREVELKHGRVAMLAAIGFALGEQFHPLFGGNIDVPSYIAFQETPLQSFWQTVIFAIGAVELFSVATFKSPIAIMWRDGKRQVYPELWQLSSDAWSGPYTTFDPLGLAPSDPAALKEIQTKELNNGRAAMVGVAGMVAQELVTGAKLF